MLVIELKEYKRNQQYTINGIFNEIQDHSLNGKKYKFNILNSLFNMPPTYVSGITIFVFFIAFAVISSLWTNFGILVINTYFPDADSKSISKAFVGVTIITLIFAYLLSYMNLNLTKFGVPTN